MPGNLTPFAKHVRFLLPVVLFTALLYWRIPSAYYCGFDDMLELHRMEFLDGKTLKTDFTVVPYESRKYRPLTLTLNRLTYELGNKSAVPFRTRNVLAHLGSICMVYGIAWLLFESIPVAALAALYFAIVPLVNQVVVGASWTVAQADFQYLLATFLFLYAVRKKSIKWLALAMLSAWIAVLIYDATVTIVGVTFAYLLSWWIIGRKKVASPRFIAALVVMTLVIVGVFFSARALLFPPGHAQPVQLRSVLVNAAIFASAPFMFFDPVLANDLFDTPLPSEVMHGGAPLSVEWMAVTILPVVCFAILALYAAVYLRKRRASLEWPNLAFLLIVFGGCCVPYLSFTDHASETYMYLPMAFFSIFLSRLIIAALTDSAGHLATRAAVAIAILLVLLYGPATWNRNQRVARCGSIVRNIFTGLREQAAGRPLSRIVLAPVPDEPVSRPYGMYGYRGIEALGYGSYGYAGIRSGIAAYLKNNDLQVETRPPNELPHACPSNAPNELCAWVHADGRVAVERPFRLP